MYEQNGKTFLKIILVIIVFLGIVGYSLYQAKNIIRGPQISLESPINGSTIATSTIAIKGSAQNVAYISLNNRQIYVDKNGTFNEQLLLAPGYNVWTIEAKDKFGRVVSKKIELVLNKS